MNFEGLFENDVQSESKESDLKQDLKHNIIVYLYLLYVKYYSTLSFFNDDQSANNYQQACVIGQYVIVWKWKCRVISYERKI